MADKVKLETVLAAVQDGLAALPSGLALLQELKASFNADEQAEIDALANLDKAADDRHAKAQNI